MPQPQILVVGAGIAGPATAFWLNRAGFDVTVVEQATQLRWGGNGVDIRGEALAVIERMGLSAGVRAGALVNRGLRFVDRHDRERARIATDGLEAMVGSEDIEIARGSLAHLLHGATSSDVEYVFGDSVTMLTQDGAGVDVTFTHGPPRRFDLVIGADGIHSVVRRLAFGPEERFRVFKNHYYAAAGADVPLGQHHWTTFYNEPGRSAAVYRGRPGEGLVTFIFHSDRVITYDHRDVEQQRGLLRAAFSGRGWYVDTLLDAAEGASDFYFDSLDQIKVPAWSTNRIALVGDAAYCASPASGAGALLALTGAYRLAGELASGDSPHRALARYEAAQRPLVSSKQGSLFTHLTVPRTRLGIMSRNLLVSSPLPRMVSRLQPQKTQPLPDYAFQRVE